MDVIQTDLTLFPDFSQLSLKINTRKMSMFPILSDAYDISVSSGSGLIKHKIITDYVEVISGLGKKKKIHYGYLISKYPDDSVDLFNFNTSELLVHLTEVLDIKLIRKEIHVYIIPELSSSEVILSYYTKLIENKFLYNISYSREKSVLFSSSQIEIRTAEPIYVDNIHIIRRINTGLSSCEYQPNGVFLGGVGYLGKSSVFPISNSIFCQPNVSDKKAFVELLNKNFVVYMGYRLKTTSQLPSGECYVYNNGIRTGSISIPNLNKGDAFDVLLYPSYEVNMISDITSIDENKINYVFEVKNETNYQIPYIIYFKNKGKRISVSGSAVFGKTKENTESENILQIQGFVKHDITISIL